MKFVITLLLLLCLMTASFVLAGESGSKPGTRTGTGSEKPLPRPGNGQQLETKQRQKEVPSWPRPYKPSEEIRVDSVVPFPVDI
ncbi:hypothetical protein C2E25_05510 [Geothermobacter hydrogeniphilus]|uniref:Uncharacterized protein n=1 Tax=Geothermobacter hydrogeniphilus TaxID=1969733 RepID=A0A2K2HC08_9BACT|nr:hypothetical protein [Geothermobacter hydrogeniphilus]PNU20842.1 hypothetical protein C2E25_05510 [Geothermobacter hydrogeniphilus]